MKNKTSTTKTSKQKVNIYNMSYNNVANNNPSTSFNPNTVINTNSSQTIDKNSPFPIWEKIYLDFPYSDPFFYNKKNNSQNQTNNLIKEENLCTFFKETKSINIDNHIYIFPLYRSDYQYAIIDIENFQISFHEMPFQCFNPIYNIQYYYSIFLFTYDNSIKSDGRYNIIEYDTKSNLFNLLPSKGVPPKARSENFCSFIYLNKIYFFGGVPKFIADNSMNYIFSYNLKEFDWKIEEYIITAQKELFNVNYIGNNYDISLTQVNNENCFYLIGGKYYDDIIYSEINNNSNKLKQAKESSEILKLEVKEDGAIELTNQKKNLKNKFGNAISIYYKDNIYIYNKDNLFLFDIKNQEISLLKKRLFAPEIENHASFLIKDKYLYLIGKFINYEDCFIFRTNLDKINNKYTGNQKTSYEYLLNYNKESHNNDIICYFNSPDDKKLYLNKMVLINFSLYIKKLLTHKNINLYDTNYNTMILILKWIYNNFEDFNSSNNINADVYKDIIYILIKYKAKSLLNIFINNININNNNCMNLYDISNKYDLTKLNQRCHKYISENLGNTVNFNESLDLKKKIYENFFCEHKIYIECSVQNLNLHNYSKTIVTNDMVDYMKNLNKNGKLFYCLNCNKVFIPNDNNNNF